MGHLGPAQGQCPVAQGHLDPPRGNAQGPKMGGVNIEPPKKGPGSVAHFLFFNLNFC